MTKFKLDENLDRRAAELFVLAGYNAVTVPEQNLQAALDAKIASICKKEKRCLITLDKHFGNTLIYPPQKYSGIIVIRPHKAILPIVLEMVREIINNIQLYPVDKSLWIVEPGRIRIHKESSR